MKAVLVTLFAGFVGCASTQAVSLADAAGFREKVLYSFGSSGTDGASVSNLTNVDGKLYGTTLVGGNYDVGTVFAIDRKTGAETVIYSFGSSGTDGAYPVGGLVDVKGTLYGTTTYGGGACKTLGNGTVFAINPSTGAETVLHSFTCKEAKSGAADPESSLIGVGGKLYGTTTGGGVYHHRSGAVFEFDPKTGKLKVLYSFCSQQNCTDGEQPGAAGVIDVNGTLYGTTAYGGNGQGVVFSLDPATRTEKVIYSFCSQQNCTDGYNPGTGLINVNGTLYGTTFHGGAGGTGDGGTVFAIDPNTDTYTLLYSFHCYKHGKVCKRGAVPDSLIYMNGMLYGTTGGGGADGGGAAFSLDPSSGVENVIHSFGNAKDGHGPYLSLIGVKDRLYGTTSSGGANDEGTVFELSPRAGGSPVGRSPTAGIFGGSE